MTTIYDQRYIKLVERLIEIRQEVQFTQVDLALSLALDQSTVSKVENFDRRLDVIELFDWLKALGYSPKKFLHDIGWLDQETNNGIPALPVPGKAEPFIEDGIVKGTIIEMAWRGQRKDVVIEGLPVQDYLAMEVHIASMFKALNTSTNSKSREVIAYALQGAISSHPDVNPSDIYHHIIYRLYLREYNRTQADRSWVRAGGEAIELFLEKHYNSVLQNHGICLVWLSSDPKRASALSEMGIQDMVGESKLDIALYGRLEDELVLFGGIHVKASLAERVTDDVPCSRAMMEKGYASYLLTFDAKSYPPPTGDLVNYGEFGTLNEPSNKRDYIESHGDFSACFCYNTRTVPSAPSTKSGKKILVSTFSPGKDQLPKEVVRAWKQFRSLRSF
ncbi:BsaWI family type II restriction enzyme [Noviherbaspirillum suwonense]|uniref:HTH cro/C1-type domain-containing protein n=1 Tax=Noviherbaspirillum suwonense TaxID=1224511 RepID=A0ABY1PT15_9BURK|nr:BsaWI family type II restriction enzyme [Noviherbaspirillum suwonense]SMP46260.1 hypothetical protein SAMN06295970_101643 [Noviherbaspirillum suwonense]